MQLLSRFVKAALTRDCIENFVRKQRHVPSLLPFFSSETPVLL